MFTLHSPKTKPDHNDFWIFLSVFWVFSVFVEQSLQLMTSIGGPITDWVWGSLAGFFFAVGWGVELTLCNHYGSYGQNANLWKCIYFWVILCVCVYFDYWPMFAIDIWTCCCCCCCCCVKTFSASFWMPICFGQESHNQVLFCW